MFLLSLIIALLSNEMARAQELLTRIEQKLQKLAYM